MTEADELAALARSYGIESEFVDARGTPRATSAATSRALLRAMGVHADGPAEVRAAREDFAARDWARAVPPVLVTGSGTIDVPVIFPRGTRAITWRIAYEDGGETSATVGFPDLPLSAKRSCAGTLQERRLIRLPGELPCGYHRMSLAGSVDVLQLIITPQRCWLPPEIVAGGRMSGIAVQLYLLRSARNWGIGDFTDLRTIVELIAARGGDVVGLNPLHALFVDDPEHASPYSPLSRLLLNVLNIDVTAIPEFAASQRARALLDEPEFARIVAASRAAAFVDYSAVAASKIAALRLVFNDFARVAAPQRRASFEQFRAAGSQLRERTYLFCALRESFAAGTGKGAAPQAWPPEYRDPASAAVSAFARDNAAAVTFFAWLEWIADTQLAAAAAAAEPMRIGLYRDLAVGADPDGAEAWCDRVAVVDGARIGAPPDIDNPAGQNWDLPPFDPHVLRARAYAGFIELVRANMRHAGALRIDHVMALAHAYWIPRDATPDDGAYVSYPLDDLVGILALESQRARCMVVGEDLGTVPEGFRERMESAGILSYRVLFFERDGGGAFIAPEAYAPLALAVFGNHDLATLAGWSTNADIALRQRLGLLPFLAEPERTRAQDRDAFMAALRRAGVSGVDAALEPGALFTATHTFLAQTASALAIAQLDDITGEVDPVNIPTTSDQYPNWRRRLSATLEELAVDSRFTEIFAIFRAAGRSR